MRSPLRIIPFGCELIRSHLRVAERRRADLSPWAIYRNCNTIAAMFSMIHGNPPLQPPDHSSDCRHSNLGAGRCRTPGVRHFDSPPIPSESRWFLLERPELRPCRMSAIAHQFEAQQLRIPCSRLDRQELPQLCIMSKTSGMSRSLFFYRSSGPLR